MVAAIATCKQREKRIISLSTHPMDARLEIMEIPPFPETRDPQIRMGPLLRNRVKLQVPI